MKLTLNKNKIELSFQYNEDIIRKVKQIRGAEWKPFPFKVWTVPFTYDSINQLQEIGFDTTDITVKLSEIEHEKQSSYNNTKFTVEGQFPFLLPYQVEAVAKGIVNKKLYLADDTGLGKTLISASIIEYFMRIGEITSNDVFAVLGLKEELWPSHIKTD